MDWDGGGEVEAPEATGAGGTQQACCANRRSASAPPFHVVHSGFAQSGSRPGRGGELRSPCVSVFEMWCTHCVVRRFLLIWTRTLPAPSVERRYMARKGRHGHCEADRRLGSAR